MLKNDASNITLSSYNHDQMKEDVSSVHLPVVFDDGACSSINLSHSLTSKIKGCGS